jgi:hypothetical protein
MRSDGRRAAKKASTSTVAASPVNFSCGTSARARATPPPTTTPSRLPSSRSAARPSEAPTLAWVTRIDVITAQKPCCRARTSTIPYDTDAATVVWIA